MKRLATVLLVFAFPLLIGLQAQTIPVSADAGGTPNAHSVHVCGTAVQGARCAADAATGSSGVPQASGAPPAGAYGPAQFHTGYNLPCSVGGTATQTICSQPATFGSQTIAIVDAYLDPNIEADLGVYDTQYGLPACTRANGCLQILNQCIQYGHGKRATCGLVDAGWALEASMDVEVAHAVCQTCKIVFVEANSNQWTDLANAENAAAQAGATEISNSWSGAEWSSETQYDSYWSHPGVAVLFAAGDAQYGSQYPSVSPTVLSVGGTTLSLNADNTYAGESAWSGTGSGCSLYEPASSWELTMPNWSATGCGAQRASGDISADADPATGAAVYDSITYNGQTGWWRVGGTSLATPLLSAAIALAGGASSYSNASQLPYVKMSGANSHDVTTGTNGTCGTVMCTSAGGYDGPTGLGTPNGLGGL